jgi:soluble lytic murein transglycosylase-like protein
LLVCAVKPGQAACALVSAGPAYGQSWAERRQELIARNGFTRPATTQLLYAPSARPATRGCAEELAGSAEVRYRLELIAPTWRRFGALITAAATRHGVPAELILAAIVEESGGRAQAVATYPGYVSDAATPNKVSLGLGQMLLSSAQSLAPERRMSRAALFDPAIAIDLVARYFARAYRVTGFDPRLAATSYNVGSVRVLGPGQRWAPPNPRYVARFVAVFEASVVHLATQPNPPAVSFAALMAAQ